MYKDPVGPNGIEVIYPNNIYHVVGIEKRDTSGDLENSELSTVI